MVKLNPLHEYWVADPDIIFKGHTLYLVGQKITDGTASPEDLDLALQVGNDICQLIDLRDIIPQEFKRSMKEDMKSIMELFTRIKKELMKGGDTG